MNKSIYEKNCEKEQPIILQKTRTLQDAVNSIKSVKGIYSSGVIEDYIAMVALLYDRQFSEISKLVNDEQYWMV